jgi:hypothetical protein
VFEAVVGMKTKGYFENREHQHRDQIERADFAFRRTWNILERALVKFQFLYPMIIINDITYLVAKSNDTSAVSALKNLMWKYLEQSATGVLLVDKTFNLSEYGPASFWFSTANKRDFRFHNGPLLIVALLL